MFGNILAIGAHFDDVELGVGGTLAKLASSGSSIYKLTLTNNKTNFLRNNINVSFEDSVRESAAACKILNINELTDFSPVECTYLKYETLLMQKLESIIFDLSITTVFLHFHSDIQQDHVAAAKLGIVASRYCRNVFYYQSNRYLLPADFYPRIFSDITDFIDIKFNALSSYSADHDRFAKLFEQTKLQNEIWGYQMSMSSITKYAEAFVPHKMVV